MPILEKITSSENLKIFAKGPIGALMFFTALIVGILTLPILQLDGMAKAILIGFGFALTAVIVVWFLILLTYKPHHLYPVDMFSNQELWLSKIPHKPNAREYYSGHKPKDSQIQEKINELEGKENRGIPEIYELATMYRLSENYPRAIELYQKIILFDPLDKFSIAELALCKKRIGDVNDAIALYEQAIALDSTFPKPKNNLAYLLAEQGEDLSRATTLINEALEEVRHNPFYIDTKGYILMKQKKYKEAKECFVAAKTIREVSGMKESKSVAKHLNEIKLMEEEEEE